MPIRSATILAAIILGLPIAAGVQDKETQEKKLSPNRSDEPMAKEFSLGKAIEFMDSAARMWNGKYRCITCHTNGLYLVAGAKNSAESKTYRATRTLARDYLKRYVVDAAKPKGQHGAIEGIVAGTSFLAISDTATGGGLGDVTRRALDHVLDRQGKSGAWEDWLKCKWPPFETDDHFGVTLAAIALGKAPKSYRATERAKRGIERLLSYLRANPPANAHHMGMLLWAAHSLPAIADAKQRETWRAEILKLQREDGGWRLVDLGGGAWKRKGDAAEDLPSDAYATGFAVFTLRRSGLPATDTRLRRGLAWLRARQRRSGRWFVRSPKRDGKHFISHAATQFAVMAFHAGGEVAR